MRLPKMAASNASPPSLWRSEARALTALVLPIVVQMGSQQMMNSVDLLFVGHLGRREMAVGTISMTLFSLTWFGVAGFGTGFDTLGSQAAGAGDAVAVRNWAMLAVACLSACCVPAAAVLALGGPIAGVLLGQDAETAADVGRFCALLALGLWPASVTLVAQKFLQVRNVVVPVAATSLATFVLNIGLNWLFIHGLGVGLLGSALATTASRVVNLVLVAAYVRFSPSDWRAVVGPFPGDVATGDGVGCGGKSASAAPSLLTAARGALAMTTGSMVRRMTALGSRGAVMVAAEASSFDVTTVFASQLGQVALDAHMAMLSVAGLTFMAGPMAFGIAANVRVGNLLGAGEPDAARAAAAVSVLAGAAWMAACALLILVFRKGVGVAFVGSRDVDVVNLVAAIAPVCAVFQVADGVLGTCNGVLRACGRQSLLARVNLGGLWGVGVFFGFVLTFPAGVGVLGLWCGLALGVGAGATVLLRLVLRLDWESEAAAARAAAVSRETPGGDEGDDEEICLVEVPSSEATTA